METKKFDLYERAILARTGSPYDGIVVKVLGVAVDQFPDQIIYIVQKDDGSLFEMMTPHNGQDKWKCVCMTSNCLDKVPSVFHSISDPKNDHQFTLDAAMKAFNHVKPLDSQE